MHRVSAAAARFHVVLGPLAWTALACAAGQRSGGMHVILCAASAICTGSPVKASIDPCAAMQVWDAVHNNLLYVWKLPRSEVPSPHHADFVSSLCFNMAADGSVQLCAGCSSGVIQVSACTGAHCCCPLRLPIATLGPQSSRASARLQLKQRLHSVVAMQAQ